VPIHFSADDETVTHDLARMERSLAELGAGSPSALAILADEGSPELLSNPARPWDDRRHALDDRGWQRLISNVDRAMELAGRVGIPTSFHPHISTYVESPWEIDRLLGSTATFLTLETGHFWLAGADPTEHLVRYGNRVHHIHLKDVRRSVLERAKAEGRSDFDAWWADVATPLGDGDVDLEGFIEALLQHGYDGWLVIEQDRLPLEHTSIDQVALEQARNRRWVERVLERLATAPGASTMGTA
jgi:inosose dehydratase